MPGEVTAAEQAIAPDPREAHRRWLQDPLRLMEIEIELLRLQYSTEVRIPVTEEEYQRWLK